MEEIVNMDIKQVKNITQELTVNSEVLSSYIDIYIGDKEDGSDGTLVLSKKGDSLVGNFARIMYSQMHQEFVTSSNSSFWYSSYYANIANVLSGVSGVVRLNFSGAVPSSPTSGSVVVGGVIGINIDGIYNYTRIDNYNIDLIGTVYSSGYVSGTGVARFFHQVFDPIGSSYQSFSQQGLFVGTGTGSVTINDYSLHKEIPNRGAVSGSLTYNNTVVSQDTNDSISAQTTITRTFTNQHTNALTVNEVGLYCKLASYVVLIGRDLIPGGVNVTPGKTLTINYRIKTILSSGSNPGGFVSSFMRLLYRQLSQSSRAVFDIDNISRTNSGGGRSTFQLIGPGGNIVDAYADNTVLSYRKNIVVGTGSTPVSMGDYYLSGPITHGKNSGQLLYAGNFIEDYYVGANNAQFSIIKYMENASGNPITINEIGLTAGGNSALDGYDSDTEFPKYYFMIARNVLTTPVTVNNGEVLKVTYIFNVSV